MFTLQGTKPCLNPPQKRRLDRSRRGLQKQQQLTPRTGRLGLCPAINKKLKLPDTGLGLQADIASAFSNMSTADLRVANTAQLDMAIADFWHSDNIPDCAVESPRFLHLMKCARLVSNQYKPPNRKRIGGELLDLNYNNCKAENKAMVLKEAGTFGLWFLSDGATIKKKPLTAECVVHVCPCCPCHCCNH